MKRMHLHVSVPDLAQSIEFYATLFGAPPSVVKDDYAKWMLEDPRVNFAISQRGAAARRRPRRHPGRERRRNWPSWPARLKAAGAETFDQEATTCCYARSDKSWVTRSGRRPLGDVLHLRRGRHLRRGLAPSRRERHAAAACCGAPQGAAAACC